MINKLTIQSIINKYYLGINEAVKWEINNNCLNIDFMTPSKDVIGNVTCNNFQLEDSKLAIYDTKKLSSLVNICNGDLNGDETKDILDILIMVNDILTDQNSCEE